MITFKSSSHEFLWLEAYFVSIHVPQQSQIATDIVSRSYNKCSPSKRRLSGEGERKQQWFDVITLKPSRTTKFSMIRFTDVPLSASDNRFSNKKWRRPLLKSSTSLSDCCGRYVIYDQKPIKLNKWGKQNECAKVLKMCDNKSLTAEKYLLQVTGATIEKDVILTAR